jgi:hypothetical protein
LFVQHFRLAATFFKEFLLNFLTLADGGEINKKSNEKFKIKMTLKTEHKKLLAHSQNFTHNHEWAVL